MKEDRTIASKPRRPKVNLVDLTTRVLEDGKAENIVTLDLARKSNIADAMIIATGQSQRQIDAIAERLVVSVKGAKGHVIGVEGRPGCDWVLIDLGDVIVHLFRPETRTLYNLEKMWSVDLPDDDPGMRATANA
ncbi:MAG: ribosome silencing factor [Alphaproteobacteria bacterium]|nr:ribosome silencing factor [Alphaproteobacteria bacterium]